MAQHERKRWHRAEVPTGLRLLCLAPASAATTQGSGWGVLAHEPLSGRLIVEQVYDHQGNVGQGATPILVFDAWEHAFYLQYKNQKVDFVRGHVAGRQLAGRGPPLRRSEVPRGCVAARPLRDV